MGKTAAKRGRGRPRKNEVPAAKGSPEDERALPFTLEEYPQLALDEGVDYSDLAVAFKKPLFADPSRPLKIAYSQQKQVLSERAKAQTKKNKALNEYNKVRERYLQKKLALSLADDAVKEVSAKAGSWTRKVFDLELLEECEWNANLQKLKEYKELHGKLPPSVNKATTDEERTLAIFVAGVRGQTADDNDDETTEKKKSGKVRLKDYPHRIEKLAELGLAFEPRSTAASWEAMFRRLVEYKEEMGTLRFPTDEQCAATGDADLIALQKWAKGQVLTHRYGKKVDKEREEKLRGIGFDYEKWYAKPAKAKRSGGKRKSPPEELAADADDRKMPAKEEAVAAEIAMEV